MDVHFPIKAPVTHPALHPRRRAIVALFLVGAVPALLAVMVSLANAQGSAKKLPPETEANISAVCGRTDTYDCYTNHKYGYVVAWPRKLLAAQGEADDGAGQLFTAQDGRAELACWAMFNNVAGQSLSKAFQDAQRESGTQVTYKHLGKDFFVLSGMREGKIFYRKTVVGSKIQASFELTYDQTLAAQYNPDAADVARSFTAHPAFSW